MHELTRVRHGIEDRGNEVTYSRQNPKSINGQFIADIRRNPGRSCEIQESSGAIKRTWTVSAQRRAGGVTTPRSNDYQIAKSLAVEAWRQNVSSVAPQRLRREKSEMDMEADPIRITVS